MSRGTALRWRRRDVLLLGAAALVPRIGRAGDDDGVSTDRPGVTPEP